jgi:hypothetical protein
MCSEGTIAIERAAVIQGMIRDRLMLLDQGQARPTPVQQRLTQNRPCTTEQGT